MPAVSLGLLDVHAAFAGLAPACWRLVLRVDLYRAGAALRRTLLGDLHACLFAHSHENYTLIFGCRAVAVALALAVEWVAKERRARR